MDESAGPASKAGGPPLDVPLPSIKLPNGLGVELVRDTSPADADLAVCSSNSRGTEGRLNRHVFEAVGLPLERLRDFAEPTTVFANLDGADVLAVQSVGPEPAGNFSLVARGLRDGLRPFVRPDGIESVWLGTLGGGAAGLSLDDSIRACLLGLGTLGGRGRFSARLDLEARLELPPALGLEHWTESSGWLEIDADALEFHASLALEVAARSAAGAPVNAAHVALAICSLVDADGGSGSEAFVRFRNLLAVDAPAAPEEPGKPEAFALHVSRHLALAFLCRPPDVRAASAIWGRDLVSILLLSRDPALEALVEGAGMSVGALRDDWLAFCLASHSALTEEQRRDWWQDFGFRTDGSVRRSGYLPEMVDVDDQLDVEAEADAFANLISDRRISPPLSIALLGDWGSGKSFFMRLIRDRVRDHTRRPAAGYCRGVVEVEFNAWQMSDANLWASLVDHIFQELQRALLGEAPKQSAVEAFESRLEEADGALHAAKLELQEASAEVTRAAEELRSARQTLAQGFEIPEELQHAADSIGMGEVLANIVRLEAAGRGLERDLRETGSVLRAALSADSVVRGAIWAGAVLVFSGLLLGGAALADPWPIVDEVLGAIAGYGATLGTVLAAVAGALQRGSTLLSGVQAGMRERIEAYQSSLGDPKSALATARDQREEAALRLRAAEERVARLRSGGPGENARRDLRRFIEERASSDDYRQFQGLISLVRRDFERLGEMLADLRSVQAPEPDASPVEPQAWMSKAAPIDRIVLYIDDLDRCKPKRVVEILEAIHLLLGLDLFVVVVSVDSRWMLRALEVHYAELLTARDGEREHDFRESTPQNYLEKIFQIPYALAPMSEQGFRRYMQFLVVNGGVRVEDIGAVPADREGAGAKGSDVRGPQSAPASGEDAAVATTATRVGSAGALLDGDGVWGRETSEEDRAALVTITRDEQTAMEKLGPLLPTPRQAKRLVNVLRLIKLQEGLARQRALRPDDDHRDPLVLLAILFGHPQLARRLFRLLFERTPEPCDDRLAGLLRQLAAALERSEVREERSIAEAARQVAGVLEANFPGVQADHCARWIPKVARYSLTTGQDWHTWVPGPAASQAQA